MPRIVGIIALYLCIFSICYSQTIRFHGRQWQHYFNHRNSEAIPYQKVTFNDGFISNQVRLNGLKRDNWNPDQPYWYANDAALVFSSGNHDSIMVNGISVYCDTLHVKYVKRINSYYYNPNHQGPLPFDSTRWSWNHRYFDTLGIDYERFVSNFHILERKRISTNDMNGNL